MSNFVSTVLVGSLGSIVTSLMLITWHVAAIRYAVERQERQAKERK